jgi:cysteine desulfurase
MELIYFDNQASTPVDSRVQAAMSPYVATFYGNPHSNDHAAGWKANEAVEAAARATGDAIGSDPDEVIFTSGATEANNLAVLGLARRAPASRRRVLVSSVEHKCVLSSANSLRTSGFVVEHIKVDSHGAVDIEDLRKRLAGDVLLVSIIAVNNELGTVQDLAEISTVVHDAGAAIHTDAAQALSAGAVDVSAWGVDLLSLSAHKIYGPKGIGALYIRRALQGQIEPLLYGGGQQRGLRSGTLPVPLCVGLGEAAKLVSSSDGEAERVRIASLRDAFVEGLRDSGLEIVVNGPPPGRRHPGNANVRFPGIDSRDLLARLQPHLAASTGSACSTGIPEPSHVLRAIGLSAQESESSVRFSLGRFTTAEEVSAAVQFVTEAARSLSVSL